MVYSFVFWPVPVFMMLSGSNLMYLNISQSGGLFKKNRTYCTLFCAVGALCTLIDAVIFYAVEFVASY